jgi:hypothetical protein
MCSTAVRSESPGLSASTPCAIQRDTGSPCPVSSITVR